MTFLILAVLVSGCAHKRAIRTATPEPSPQPAPAPAPTVAPPEAALTVELMPDDPLDGDLDAVNRYVREQGLLADLLFDYDRHDLGPDARRRLAANARFLKESPQFVIALEGHADERGTIEYNLSLAQMRAAATSSSLDNLGVSRDRLVARSYGEERPLCTEKNESCWQRNRRVHFEIVGRVE